LLKKRKEKKTLKIVREAKSCAWTVKTMKTFFGRKEAAEQKWDQQKWEVLGSLLESYRIKL